MPLGSESLEAGNDGSNFLTSQERSDFLALIEELNFHNNNPDKNEATRSVLRSLSDKEIKMLLDTKRSRNLIVGLMSLDKESSAGEAMTIMGDSRTKIDAMTAFINSRNARRAKDAKPRRLEVVKSKRVFVMALDIRRNEDPESKSGFSLTGVKTEVIEDSDIAEWNAAQAQNGFTVLARTEMTENGMEWVVDPHPDLRMPEGLLPVDTLNNLWVQHNRNVG